MGKLTGTMFLVIYLVGIVSKIQKVWIIVLHVLPKAEFALHFLI